MNKNDMMKAMGEISPEFIDEAGEKGRKHTLLRLGTVAACFLLVAAVIAIPIAKGVLPATYPEATGNGTTPGEIVLIPRWEEMTNGERYRTILDARYSDFQAMGVAVDDTSVGEHLADATAEGFDSYEKATHQAPVRLYTVNGADAAYVICAKFDGSDACYLFVNTDTSFATLGAFTKAFGLSESLSLTGSAYRTGKLNDSPIYVDIYGTQSYELTDSEGLRKLLLAGADAPSVTEPEPHAERITFGCDCSFTGQKNVSLTVYLSGYLVTNIGETAKAFDIGEDRASEIFAYFKAHSTPKKFFVQYHGDDDSATQGTVAGGTPIVITTPPYNPHETTCETETAANTRSKNDTHTVVCETTRR